MRIEFIPWSENIEVQLCDDGVIDSFYTRNQVIVCDNRGADVEFLFHQMESMLGPPKIGGQFAAHHPYWEERKARRAARATKLGLT